MSPAEPCWGVNTATGDETAAFGGHNDPVWSADSKRFAFSATVGNDIDLFVTGLDPADRLERLKHLSGMQWAEHWSADGKWFFYSQTDSASKVSLWALPLDGDREPFVVVDLPAVYDEPQLSPDGRWLAYTSNESGRFEVYVQPFRRQGERWRHSTDGGGQPKWRRDGRELYYFTLDGRLMTASVQPNGEPGPPRVLFPVPWRPDPILDQFAVTGNGQRFLIITPIRSDRTARIGVVSDWPGLLKK